VTSFEALYAIAVANKGSSRSLEAIMPSMKTLPELAEISDDRYLSMMTRCVFRAGFVWRVIDNKWLGFERAFANFNPLAVAHFSNERLEELAQDTSIVRNFTKIVSVRNNAVYILDKKRKHGTFGSFVANWPSEDIIGLWLELKKHGCRLGGNTGPMMLRSMGKDTFLMTKDVCDALVNHGFIEKFSPTSQRDLKRVQVIFNDLSQESGRPLCEVSRILACTV
jgi:3-methyladenine DNA glycosylase Tag